MAKAKDAIFPGISAPIVIAIIFILGFGVSMSSASNTTTVSTNNSNLSGQSNISSTSSGSSPLTTYCVVPDTGYVYLHVVSSSGDGLANISVLETPKANSCFGYPPFPTPTNQETNATGYVGFGGIQSNYYYIINLNYSGRSYNFTLPQGPPGEYTMATFGLTNGILNILFCTPQPYSCSQYTSATTTLTPNVTTSTSVQSGSVGLHILSFNQAINCPPDSSLYGSYFSPWSVTLIGGSYNMSKVQPPGSTVNPNSEGGCPCYKEYSSISFSVPNGTYNYTIYPTRDFENNQSSSSGTVTINGNNATVYVSFRLASCGSLVTVTTTTNETALPSTQSSSASSNTMLSIQELWYLPGILIILVGIFAVAFIIRKTQHVES